MLWSRFVVLRSSGICSEAENFSPSLVGAVQSDPEEVFETDGDWTLLLRVALTECVGEALNFDAKNDELIDWNFSGICALHGNQELNELRWETEAHLKMTTKLKLKFAHFSRLFYLWQRLREFRFRDCSRLIAIISFEAVEPRVDVLEKLLKFVHVNGSAAIGIEHWNHQGAAPVGEVLSLSVDKRGLKLLSVDFTAAIFVDLTKDTLSFGADGWWLLLSVAAGVASISLKIRIKVIDFCNWLNDIYVETDNSQKFTSMTHQSHSQSIIKYFSFIFSQFTHLICHNYAEPCFDDAKRIELWQLLLITASNTVCS